MKFFFGDEAANWASLARAVLKPLAIVHSSLTVRGDKILAAKPLTGLVLHVLC